LTKNGFLESAYRLSVHLFLKYYVLALLSILFHPEDQLSLKLSGFVHLIFQYGIHGALFRWSMLEITQNLLDLHPCLNNYN
jgi:hypothetical protein